MHPFPRIAHIVRAGGVGGGSRIVLDLASHDPGHPVVVSVDDGPLLADAHVARLQPPTLPYAGEFSAGVPL